MKKFLAILCAITALYSNAQTGIYRFEWKPKPAIHSIPKDFQEAAAVFVADERIVEYAFEKDELYLFRTLHRIVHINNDRGIESFNKIYLPFGEDVSLVDVKARTILPNGKIIELNRSNIKDIKDEDGEYKIFALEGLTKGCEVEFYYTVRRPSSFFGREMMSSAIPVMHSRFQLISPEHLVFEAKPFNGMPGATDTIHGEKRYVTINEANLKAQEEEKYSMYDANLKRVEYKLSYNTSREKRERMFTWNDLAKRLHEIYNVTSDKEDRKLKDLLETINIKSARNDAEKIIAIENYLKKNFISRDDIPSEDASDLGAVIKNKVASERAIMRIYLALFRLAGVDYQVVLAGDRTDFTIEKGFENWNNARHFLVYFPAVKKFIAPTESEYRYPWIPPTWAATNGLFCVTTTIGNFTTSIGEVRAIPLEAYEHNYLNMEMNMKLDQNDAMMVEVKQLYGGYAAPNYRAPFVYLPTEEQDKVLKEMISFGTAQENILKHSFENKELESSDPYKPFVINASVKTTNLIEHAGNRIIVKIGEVIGEQAQMYESKTRSSRIDLHYPHALVRTLRLTIPEGY
ncbi:MAG TPA: DUF3857 domain-containing protein, partial [Flavisolibacter sp.]